MVPCCDGRWQRRIMFTTDEFTTTTLLHPWKWNAWWRHQMKTFFALLAFCAENSPVPGEFSSQRPVTRSFDVFFDLHLNKRWVNNPEAGDLRRHRAHCDVSVMENYSWDMCHWHMLDYSQDGHQSEYSKHFGLASLRLWLHYLCEKMRIKSFEIW